MNWTAAKDIVQLAKQWPSPATIAVLLALVGYGLYAHFGPRYALGEDLAAVERRVSHNTEDVAELKEGAAVRGSPSALFTHPGAPCPVLRALGVPRSRAPTGSRGGLPPASDLRVRME